MGVVGKRVVGLVGNGVPRPKEGLTEEYPPLATEDFEATGVGRKSDWIVELTKAVDASWFWDYIFFAVSQQWSHLIPDTNVSW